MLSEDTIKRLAQGATELRRLLTLARRSVLRPPPRMTVPDWADSYRRLSMSAGAVGGPWQTHRVEVARGPMMAVTEPGVTTISIMCCTQTMKTSVMENTLGYFAHLDPSPMLLLQPKDEMADAFSKERIAPMVANSPELRKLMGDSRTRTGDDTLRFKKFPGGFLAMASAGSPSNLAMRAIRIVLLDEVDKYEVTKEGDPIQLAEERTATFNTSRLSIRACSPTWAETSRIYRSYLEGDQRKPFLPCPHCEHWQTLDFSHHVKWNTEGDVHQPDTAHIFCESCGTEWSEAERLKLITTKYSIRHQQTKAFTCCGEHQEPMKERLWDWDEKLQVGYAICKHCGERAVPNRHASFWASKLYSPFITVVELVEKWVAAQGDPESMQTFVNTQLGLPFRAEAQKVVDSHYLAARAEQYQAPVPHGVAVLTAGVDVQSGGDAGNGRIEVEVVGWGPGEESWSIDHSVIEGDPAKPEVWEKLDKYLLQGFMHELGFPMYITAACVDSGGHNTQDVYNFARARVGRNVWAIKGASDKSATWSPVWPASAKERRNERFRTGYRPIIIGVNAAKESTRQRLLITEQGPGYCHFPVGRPNFWFDQLTSEELRVERRSGQSVRWWHLPPKRRNEALDCRVYAYAALQGLYHVRRLNLEKRMQVILAHAQARVTPSQDGLMDLPPAPPAQQRPKRVVTPSPFMNG